MSDFVIPLLLFTCKAVIAVLLILFLLAACVAILAKSNQKPKGKLTINNLNKQYDDMNDTLFTELLPKKSFKKMLKSRKMLAKKETKNKKNIFVLHFQGDVQASAVSHLREEITAILSVANPQDEVVLTLQSAGGIIHGYGLAAAQLMRLRKRHLFLTVIIDKVAASGGYMMACVANKILAAPFAIVGSIGVIVQLPNFHRFLQAKQIDFEQLTAGQYKRTLTLFGENTEEQREKLKQELTDMHEYFKQLILSYRPQITIDQVATGEYWLGQQALPLKLIDEINTSDDYLSEQSMTASLYEIAYTSKKSLSEKLSGSISKLYKKTLTELNYSSHNVN